MYMTLTVVWHDVVLIANPVNIELNSFPSLLYFGQTLFSSLSNLLFFCSPSKFTPPHTQKKMIGPLVDLISLQTKSEKPWIINYSALTVTFIELFQIQIARYRSCRHSWIPNEISWDSVSLRFHPASD